MAAWRLPDELVASVTLLTSPLHARLAWRLRPVLSGMLFARGRRTAASWWRAAWVGLDFRSYYYFLGSLGRKVEFGRKRGRARLLSADFSTRRGRTADVGQENQAIINVLVPFYCHGRIQPFVSPGSGHTISTCMLLKSGSSSTPP